MKKITLLSALVIGFISYAQFDWSTNPLDNGWVEYAGANGEGTVESWTYFPDDDAPFMYITWEASTGFGSCEDWLVSPLVEITNTSSQLDFGVQDQYGTDYGSTLSIQVSTTDQNSGFSEIASFTEADISPSAILSADLSAYEGSSIYIAFVWINNDGDRLYLYDLELNNQNASAPLPATAPNPADGATVNLSNNVDYDNNGIIDESDYAYTFTWSSQGDAGEAPTSYGFKFGSTPDMTSIDTSTTQNDGFSIYGLVQEATYYWQIIPTNAGGSAAEADCPVWSFTTSSTLSVEDLQLSAVVVSPNPVKDILNIDSPVAIDAVNVFNQLGQRVLDVEGSVITNNQIDLSPLNPGVYMVKVISQEKSKTIKVIKE
jgi:hypothetical protein